MEAIELGHGVVMRPFQPTEGLAVFVSVQKEWERLAAWMPWVWHSTLLEHSVGFVEWAAGAEDLGEAQHYALVDGDRIVGSVGATLDALDRTAEAGYWILSGHEGRGLVSQAMEVVLERLFARSNVHRVTITAAVGSSRSRAIPERLGFAFEAIKRQALWRGDRVHDAAYYSLLRSEWGGGGVAPRDQ